MPCGQRCITHKLKFKKSSEMLIVLYFANLINQCIFLALYSGNKLLHIPSVLTAHTVQRIGNLPKRTVLHCLH